MGIDVVEELAPDDHQPELLLARLGRKLLQQQLDQVHQREELGEHNEHICHSLQKCSTCTTNPASAIVSTTH